MSDDQMFEGFRFDRDRIAELETIAADRGDTTAQPYFDELKRRTADWDEARFRDSERQAADVERRLLSLLREGVGPADSRVLDVLDEDVATQREIMPLTADDYGKLAHAFAAAPELRAHLDERDPRLAEFFRDAMLAYAAARM